MEEKAKAAEEPRPSTSSGQSARMESVPNHLCDTLNAEKMKGMVEYLVVEGNLTDGTPELKLQAVDVIGRTDKTEFKVMDANAIKHSKSNHVCTLNCFPTRKYFYSRKNEQEKEEMLVCPLCVLECPKGDGKRALLELDSLSSECKKRVTKELTQESEAGRNKSGTEKQITLETFQGASQGAEDDQVASGLRRAQEEEELWNEFFEKQDKGEMSDFFEVLGAALGKKLSRGSRVPCHLCFRVLPLWLHRCHVRHYHDPYKMNVCNRCTRRYSTTFLLRRHLGMAHKRYIGNCVECRQTQFKEEMLILKRNGHDNYKKQKKAKSNVTNNNIGTGKSEENKNESNEKRKIA